MVQLILRIFSYLHPKSRVGAGQLLILLKIHILASQIEMFMWEDTQSCLCIDSVSTGWHVPSNTKMLAFKHHWKVRFMPAWRYWSENEKPMKRLQSSQLPILLGNHRTSHDPLPVQHDIAFHVNLHDWHLPAFEQEQNHTDTYLCILQHKHLKPRHLIPSDEITESKNNKKSTDSNKLHNLQINAVQNLNVYESTTEIKIEKLSGKLHYI